MAIILITTTDLGAAREACMRRLLASVAQDAGTDIRHFILLQNADGEALARFRETAGGHGRVFAVQHRVSLSEARNRLIAEVLSEAPPGAGDVVAFPDDDCWFPPGFLAGLARVFAARDDLDMLVCRMALTPDGSPLDAETIEPLSVRQVVRLSSSNNIFVRGSVMALTGSFDPALGLGTPAGGGEDTDYAIRAFLASRGAGFVDRALVGHAAPDRTTAVKYFRGAMIVLARHALRRPALAAECGRKVLVGAYFTARGRLSPDEYIGGLARAFSGRSRAPAVPFGKDVGLERSRP